MNRITASKDVAICMFALFKFLSPKYEAVIPDLTNIIAAQFTNVAVWLDVKGWFIFPDNIKKEFSLSMTLGGLITLSTEDAWFAQWTLVDATSHLPQLRVGRSGPAIPWMIHILPTSVSYDMLLSLCEVYNISPGSIDLRFCGMVKSTCTHGHNKAYICRCAIKSILFCRYCSGTTPNFLRFKNKY